MAGREQRIEAAAEASHVEERISRRKLPVESDNGLHKRVLVGSSGVAREIVRIQQDAVA